MSDFKSSVAIRPSVRQVTLLPDNHLIHSIVSIRYKTSESFLYEISSIVLVLLGMKFMKELCLYFGISSLEMESV